MNREKEVFARLAVRHEGNFMNAYYALPDTTEGWALLGSIHVRFFANDTLKESFVALMRDAMSHIITEITGGQPTWDENPTPVRPHERGGNA